MGAAFLSPTESQVCFRLLHSPLFSCVYFCLVIISPNLSPPHKDLASFQLFGSQEPSKSPSCHQLSDPGRVSSNRSQTHLQTALCSLNPFVKQSPPSSDGLLFAFLMRRHEMPGERVQLPSDLESPASQRGSLSVIPAASSQPGIKDSMRGRQ